MELLDVGLLDGHGSDGQRVFVRAGRGSRGLRFFVSNILVATVAVRLVGAALALAKESVTALFGGDVLRREAGAAVGTVTEGLAFRPSAGTEEVVLALLEFAFFRATGGD